MATIDLDVRTYALPWQLVATICVNSANACSALTEAATRGLELLENRLDDESSIDVFAELNKYIDTYMLNYLHSTYDVTLSRRARIKLNLTAKEYGKSQDEMMTYCLTQSII